MKIYSMTATFGKLEHQTLRLEPGLNVIEAPNEWGKSTWCAFLVTMLYGLDTRQKTTRAALADKEKYAPWSGAPMAGRIDLNWEGKDITIERSTKGRVPLGEFKAYETASGLPVHGLTGLNCGQQLLGVERGVFTRAGFVRLADMPVTQDEALRRRLNSLVTTGDESGAGDKLAQKLKELKNRCRFNRTGLIPQAEAERDELEQKLADITALHGQQQRLRERMEESELRQRRLENHKAALQYEASRERALRLERARAECTEAAQRLQALEQTCSQLPAREVALQNIQAARELNEEWMALHMESQMLPPAPQAPVVAPQFLTVKPENAVLQAQQDQATYASLVKKRWMALLVVGLVALVAAVGLVVLEQMIPALVCAVTAAVLLVVRAVLRTGRSKRMRQLEAQRGGKDPSKWMEDSQEYALQAQQYADALEAHQRLREDLNNRLKQLEQDRWARTGGKSLQEYMTDWDQVVKTWDACGDARREIQRCESNLQTLTSAVHSAQAPSMPDEMTFTAEETARLISDNLEQQRMIQTQLGVCQGKIEALGSETPLQSRLRAVQSRIDRLEETYRALEYAQHGLQAASRELQRRFAPRIAKRAQELFAKFTDGRYDRLMLEEDLSLNSAAQGEDTLHSAQWRSDGTADQLYLALRLAVAEELTPQAPLVLDDALVRFDDQRLQKALQILQQEAEDKQVILFTCQSREMQYLN